MDAIPTDLLVVVIGALALGIAGGSMRSKRKLGQSGVESVVPNRSAIDGNIGRILGALTGEEQSWTRFGLRRELVGELELPSGQLVTCDPLSDQWNSCSLAQTVRPGTYQTFIFWLERSEVGSPVAFAMTQFSTNQATSWRAAKLQNVEELARIYVDNGYAAHTSPEAMQAFQRTVESAMKNSPDFGCTYDSILSVHMHHNSPDHLAYKPEPKSAVGLTIFETGYGDGTYENYFGYDESGQPVALVSSFDIESEFFIPERGTQ